MPRLFLWLSYYTRSYHISQHIKLGPYVEPSLFIPFPGIDVDEWIFKLTQGEPVPWQPLQGRPGFGYGLYRGSESVGSLCQTLKVGFYEGSFGVCIRPSAV